MSDGSFVIGCANEKVSGPTAVNQSIPIPTELLIPFLSKELYSLHPIYLRRLQTSQHLHFERFLKSKVKL